MSDCIFCDIITGDSESFMVANSPHAVAFLDIAPLARGHTLVVPNWHVADLIEGGADVLTVVAPLVEEVSRLLVDRLDADGINLLQSSGSAAGQEVFHFHLHLVPRWKGDGVFNRLIGYPSESQDLDALHQHLVG
jgi:histidine triad (HIT) family protein